MTRDLDLERRLLAIEELMTTQKIDFDKAQKEIGSKKAAELAEQQKAEADMLAAKIAAEEWAAWEKKLEEGKKAARVEGSENAKKHVQADREIAEEKAAKEKARADAKAAVLKAEADAKAAVERAEAEAKAAIEKAQKQAAEAVAEAQKRAEFLVEQALAPVKDEKKRPVKFKDAIGRKFSFPFHLCATWAVCTYFIVAVVTNANKRTGHRRVNQTSFLTCRAYRASCRRGPL